MKKPDRDIKKELSELGILIRAIYRQIGIPPGWQVAIFTAGLLLGVWLLW